MIENEMQEDWVNTDDCNENNLQARIQNAMNEHVDFIIGTDKNYIVEAVMESDDASDALLALCTFDINRVDMSDNNNLKAIGKLAVTLNAAIEAYVHDSESLKHG